MKGRVDNTQLNLQKSQTNKPAQPIKSRRQFMPNFMPKQWAQYATELR
jgi:hypothetical protein